MGWGKEWRGIVLFSGSRAFRVANFSSAGQTVLVGFSSVCLGFFRLYFAVSGAIMSIYVSEPGVFFSAAVGAFFSLPCVEEFSFCCDVW